MVPAIPTILASPFLSGTCFFVFLVNASRFGYSWLWSSLVSLVFVGQCLFHNGCLALFCTATVYNSYRYVQLLQEKAGLAWGTGCTPANPKRSIYHTASIYNSYREDKLSNIMEASLSDTASIHNSSREGKLSVRMEASLFLIQVLYTTHIEKADSLI